MYHDLFSCDKSESGFQNCTALKYKVSADMRVYLWRDEVEGNDPVMTVEYKPDEWNPDYDIINNPEEFRLYVDGELVEYE